MTFLSPIFFYIALSVAAGVVGLHFIVTRQPTSSALPTVRFIPVSQVRVTTVAPRPEDRLLMLARVLIILLIGAALARPVSVPRRHSVERIVLADVSSGVGSIAAVRDSARSLLKDGGLLIVFDSGARVLDGGAADAAEHLTSTPREGRLSPALIAALRAASRIRDRADSFALEVVSPLRASEFDGATLAIRALWPGRIRIVDVPAAADSLAAPQAITVRAAAGSEDGDPVALASTAIGLSTGAGGGDAAVRVIRSAATVADSEWAASGRRTLVRWPAADSQLHPGWVARARPDTIQALVAGEAALVYPLERRWQLDPATRPTRVAARWVDGEPAAVERVVGAGCIRDVAIPVPSNGDLVLRPAFARLLRALVSPCEAVSGGPRATPGTVHALVGAGPLAARDVIHAPDVIATPLVPWLLAIALLLVLLEPLVRRGSAPPWTAQELEETFPVRGAAAAWPRSRPPASGTAA